MSEFFKALEQAERDRALGQQARQTEVVAIEAPVPVAEEPPVAATVEAVEVAPIPAPRPAPPVVRRPSEERPARVERPSADRELLDGVDAHMVSLLTPVSFDAEQYRALRYTIEQLHKNSNLTVVGVSSPSAGDGKTTTAINLAGALAQAPNARILLVDMDLRRPSVGRQLTLSEAGPGLVGAIIDPKLTLEDVVRRRPPFNLSVLHAGRPPTAPYELLKSPRVAELIEEARRGYDYVILDMPPLVGVPDSRVIAHHVDGILLIVAAHWTPKKLVEEALSLLEPAKTIGLVFNRDDRPFGGYSGYGYGYGHGAPTTSNSDGGGNRWLRRVAKPLRRRPG